MNEVQDLCRYVFRAERPRTFPVSGTSRAGLEAVLCSMIEPGDRVAVGVAGRFGELLADIAARCGAEVARIELEWGRIIEPDVLAAAVGRFRPSVVALVHGDTSTGVLQPLPELVDIAHARGAAVVVDAVLTLGGTCVDTDAWGIDVCVAGTQKCLGCPSGMAPLTYTEAVERRILARRRPVQSNYLDLGQIQAYWGPGRLNHHTLPTSMTYALREALRLVYEEGLGARWVRHARAGAALHAGLQAMGLTLFGDPVHRLPMLAIAGVPDGISEPAVRADLLARHTIEIMGAFGRLQGRAWRIGVMASNAEVATVVRFLEAFEDVLTRAGARIPPHAGPDAAARAAGGSR
jgi:(S)-ureidoglycine-glyoxylate aminotransferase